MAAAIELRKDFGSRELRALAKASRDASQARRLLALAEIYDGGSRTDAARIGGVGLQTVRDWVMRFNARGPDRLIDLVQWVWDEFGISLSEATMSRELKALGYAKLSARPRHHAQNEVAIADFKKDFRPSWRRSGPGSRQARI
jgi:transposase